jgi:hypothetical protein
MRRVYIISPAERETAAKIILTVNKIPDQSLRKKVNWETDFC